jgi:hypothetical protein
MTTCFKCQREMYFSHKLEIDGKEEAVCGNCIDMVCAICGKTRHNDGITRWSIEVDPETGATFTVGSCCTFVMGKMDMFKLYSEKYNNMRKNNPEMLENIVNEGQRKAQARQQVLQKPEVADRLIDNWSRSKKSKREK